MASYAGGKKGGKFMGKCASSYRSAEERREWQEKIARLQMKPSMLRGNRVHFEALRLTGRDNPTYEVFRVTPKSVRSFDEVWPGFGDNLKFVVQKIVQHSKRRDNITLCPVLVDAGLTYTAGIEKMLQKEFDDNLRHFGVPRAQKILLQSALRKPRSAE